MDEIHAAFNFELLWLESWILSDSGSNPQNHRKLWNETQSLNLERHFKQPLKRP